MATPLAPEPRVVQSNEQFALGVLEDVVLLQVLCDPEPDVITELSRAIYEVVQTHARAVVILHFKDACADLPYATRSVVTALMRESFALSHAWTIVVEGTGSRAANLRSLFAALHRDAGVHLRMRILSGIDGAARWAKELSTQLDNPHEVLGLFQALSSSSP